MNPQEHDSEAASGIEPLYRALQALYAAAESLVRAHFIRPGERPGSETEVHDGEQRSVADAHDPSAGGSPDQSVRSRRRSTAVPMVG